MDELRRGAGIPTAFWKPWETLAYTLWTIHFGIMNSGRSPRRIGQMQVLLNEAANRRVLQEISSNPELAKLSDDEKQAAYVGAMSLISDRASKYNERFNRDKVRALQDVDDLEPQNVEMANFFLSNLGPAASERLKDKSQLVAILMGQLMVTAASGFVRGAG
ncbi:MAG TPA: hypothetical protein VFB16_15110 [Bauldia sp.]|nr:hypothetical protein [Bauldia sp.]